MLGMSKVLALLGKGASRTPASSPSERTAAQIVDEYLHAVVPTMPGYDPQALGAASVTEIENELFQVRNAALNRGAVDAVSGIGTMVVEVIGDRNIPKKVGDRAMVYIKSAEELGRKLAMLPGEVITIDFVVSTEVVAKQDRRADRVHAVVTYKAPPGSRGISHETRTLVEPMSDNDEAAVRATKHGAHAARRGVLTKRGLLFIIDRQVHLVDGSDPSTYMRNNLRYSVNRSDLIFGPLAGVCDLRKCTHTIAQDMHVVPNVPSQETVDAYVFKAKVPASHPELRHRRSPLGPRDGVDADLDERSQESISANSAAARGIRLPDGSTVRIVQFRPTRSVSTVDVHAHMVNLLAKVADEGDVVDVLGLDFQRPWGFHDKKAPSPYLYFYPCAFLRTVDGPNGVKQENQDHDEPLLTPAEYRAMAPMIDGKRNFDGVVHDESGYGAAVIEEFAAPITIDGKTPTTEEQHLRFLKLIHAWFIRQEKLGRDPEILATSFALEEAEYTTPTDKQYRRRLRVYFRDRNVPERDTWEKAIYPDSSELVLTTKQAISAEISARTREGIKGFNAGGDDAIFVSHLWSPPPGPGNPGVRDATYQQLLQFRDLFNQNPGLKPVEFIPMRYAWEGNEGLTGASYTDVVVIRAKRKK